jgi:hypothetical protein
MAKDLIVKVDSGGYPLTTPVNLKPNWTSAGPRDGKPVMEKIGVNTDLDYLEGWAQGMKEIVDTKYAMRECCCPRQWEAQGYSAMAARNNIDLRDLSTMEIWELKEGRDLVWKDVENGYIFKKIAHMAPMTAEGTFLVNIAKMKAHGMGITAAIKNLQGICARRFHNFCTAHSSIRKAIPEYYHQFFLDNFEEVIVAHHKRHLEMGIPRWDRPTDNRGGIWQETWCARGLDNLSVTPVDLHMVEGIISQDGNGFGVGPHEKINGVGSRDYLSNMVLFGIDPFRVDIITHYLAGHEPGNFGMFHIGIERGMSNVLDPKDIPVYLWSEGKATLSSLDKFTRTPLVTYYLQRDYNGQAEPEFHLCDEPFDYSAFKAPKTALSPSIRHLGNDNSGNRVVELTVPANGNVKVEVMDSRGSIISRSGAQLVEGVHQLLVNELKPGMYSMNAKGAGWEISNRMFV